MVYRDLISENVLEKVAVFTVACCTVAGTTGSILVALAAPAAAVAGVLGAVGLKVILQRDRECDRAWRAVFKRLPRQYALANEVEPEIARSAAKALGQALDRNDVLSLGHIRRALEEGSDVVAALTRVTLASIAKRDVRFAAGLYLELAEDVLNAAFAAAIEECSQFTGLANLALSEATLTEVRRLGKSLGEIQKGLETPVALEQLNAFSEEFLTRMRSELDRFSTLRGSIYVDSFFVVSSQWAEDQRLSQSIGVAVDNGGRIVVVTFGRRPTRVTLAGSDVAIPFKIISIGDTLTELHVQSRTSGIVGEGMELENFQDGYAAFEQDGNNVELTLNEIEGDAVVMSNAAVMLRYDGVVMFQSRKGRRPTLATPVLNTSGEVVALTFAYSHRSTGDATSIYAIPWFRIAPPQQLNLNWMGSVMDEGGSA